MALCVCTCVCAARSALQEHGTESETFYPIQTCWHVLSFSPSLPLYYSPPLFNPPLLKDRLVNTWLVLVNAANSCSRLRAPAAPVHVRADLLCLKPFFPPQSELFNSWTLDGLALLLSDNNWSRFFLFIPSGSLRFSHLFIPFSSRLTDRQTCPPATSLTLANFIYGPDWHFLHTRSHRHTVDVFSHE